MDNPTVSVIGYEFIASEFLTNVKIGVCVGRRVAVSPAFMSLLQSAKDETELVPLLRSLRVLNLPE